MQDNNVLEAFNGLGACYLNDLDRQLKVTLIGDAIRFKDLFGETARFDSVLGDVLKLNSVLGDRAGSIRFQEMFGDHFKQLAETVEHATRSVLPDASLMMAFSESMQQAMAPVHATFEAAFRPQMARIVEALAHPPDWQDLLTARADLWDALDDGDSEIVEPVKAAAPAARAFTWRGALAVYMGVIGTLTLVWQIAHAGRPPAVPPEVIDALLRYAVVCHEVIAGQ